MSLATLFGSTPLIFFLKSKLLPLFSLIQPGTFFTREQLQIGIRGMDIDSTLTPLPVFTSRQTRQ